MTVAQAMSMTALHSQTNDTFHSPSNLFWRFYIKHIEFIKTTTGIQMWNVSFNLQMFYYVDSTSMCIEKNHDYGMVHPSM